MAESGSRAGSFPLLSLPTRARVSPGAGSPLPAAYIHLCVFRSTLGSRGLSLGAPSLLSHRFCCLRSGLGVFMFVYPCVELAPPRREHFPCVDAGQNRSFSFSPVPDPFCLLHRVYLQWEKLPRSGWRQKASVSKRHRPGNLFLTENACAAVLPGLRAVWRCPGEPAAELEPRGSQPRPFASLGCCRDGDGTEAGAMTGRGHHRSLHLGCLKLTVAPAEKSQQLIRVPHSHPGGFTQVYFWDRFPHGYRFSRAC